MENMKMFPKKDKQSLLKQSKSEENLKLPKGKRDQQQLLKQSKTENVPLLSTEKRKSLPK